MDVDRKLNPEGLGMRQNAHAAAPSYRFAASATKRNARVGFVDPFQRLTGFDLLPGFRKPFQDLTGDAQAGIALRPPE
jgi:hypothetical protein